MSAGCFADFGAFYSQDSDPLQAESGAPYSQNV